MANTTYQIILSTDGKHTVIVTTEDGAQAIAAREWAEVAYDHLIERYGYKGEHRPVSQGEAIEAPICAVHQKAMVQQQGRRGAFWSCHEKNADGSWCTYKPPTA